MVDRGCNRQDRGVNMESILVSNVLDLSPLVVGVQIGIASPHNTISITFGLNIPDITFQYKMMKLSESLPVRLCTRQSSSSKRILIKRRGLWWMWVCYQNSL